MHNLTAHCTSPSDFLVGVRVLEGEIVQFCVSIIWSCKCADLDKIVHVLCSCNDLGNYEPPNGLMLKFLTSVYLVCLLIITSE